MKIYKAIVKNALIAIIAVGAAAESAKAAQAIHADYAGMNPQQVKREASRLRHIVDTAGPAIPPEFAPLVPAVAAFRHADATGTRELFTAVATGDLDPYVDAAKAAVADALDDYMDNVIMNAGNNAVILGTVANGAVNQPADLLRDSFKAALRDAIEAPDAAALHAIDNHVAVPASLNLHVLSETQRVTFGALETVVQRWIDTLLPGGNAPFLDAGVHVGHGDEPADNTRNAFKAALVNVIDGINL